MARHLQDSMNFNNPKFLNQLQIKMRYFNFIRTTTLIAGILLLNACGSDTNKNRLNITGAFALYPLAIKWSDVYKKTHPNIRFDISGGGAGKGLTDVLASAADIGMFSRDLTPEEKAKGIWSIAVAIDAVIPTVSAQNPSLKALLESGLSQEQFKTIFLSGAQLTWGSQLGTADSGKINVYTRSDAAGAADTWAKYLGSKQERIKGIGIYGDPGLADAIAKDPEGIGFNNVAYIYDAKTGHKYPGIEVVPIDIDGNHKIDTDENFYKNSDAILNAIAKGKYPAPPARELYFISKGKPVDPEVIAFLKWILTDGQAFVKEAGFVPLEPNKIAEQLSKLN